MTLVGYKLNTIFEIFVLLQRRFELTDNLALLQRQLEDEGCEKWVNDVEHDTMVRELRQQEIDKDMPDAVASIVKDVIEQSVAIFDAFDQCPGRAQGFGLDNATMESAAVKVGTKSGRFICHIEAIVSGTPGEVAAFLMATNSRYQDSTITRGTTHYLLADVNAWHSVMYREEHLPFPFRSRSFLCDVVCRKTSLEDEPAAYLVAMQPRQSQSLIPSLIPSDAKKDHTVRGELSRVYRLAVSDEPGCTAVKYASILDLKPSWQIPTKMLLKILPLASIQRLLAPVLHIQIYLQHIKPLEACSPKDGELVGEAPRLPCCRAQSLPSRTMNYGGTSAPADPRSRFSAQATLLWILLAPKTAS
jgi:hypothetical protein